MEVNGKELDGVLLVLRVQTHPLYPCDREFTYWEAWTDLLLKSHPTGVVERSMAEWATAWQWNKSKVARYFAELVELKHLAKAADTYVICKYEAWYGLPPQNDVKEKTLAKTVIDLFNKIFSREISLNDYRQRTICARFREGKKLSPPIELKQFKAVFEFKKKEWSEDPATAKWLTIETLCSKKHFLKYLDQARLAVKTGEAQGQMAGSIINQNPTNQ